MKVIFTLPAKRSLDAVYEYHKSQGTGKTGRKIRAAIIKKAMTLKAHPQLGQEKEPSVTWNLDTDIWWKVISKSSTELLARW